MCGMLPGRKINTQKAETHTHTNTQVNLVEVRVSRGDAPFLAWRAGRVEVISFKESRNVGSVLNTKLQTQRHSSHHATTR